MPESTSATALAATTSAHAWAEAKLPDAWPDELDPRRPSQLWRLLRGAMLRQTRPVRLPPGLPGAERLPRYLLQEFHHLPNGNYSKTLTRGYALWFDRVMLGSLHRARRDMARRLAGARCVLDVGSGGGHTGGALQEAGVPEVWALEPSPYLLQHAARRYPELNYAQGVIERTTFADGQFDGATACFVFHEIPPRYADRALAELHRVLKPGARLLIAEPSAQQWRDDRRTLWRRHGWRGLYFKFLAKRVFEPFTAAWHERKLPAWFASHGFVLEEDRDEMPCRLLVARRAA